MDNTEKNNLAKTLSSKIDIWYNIEEKCKYVRMKDIVKFICDNYKEEADKGWLKQISKYPKLLGELFKKDEDGYFKYSTDEPTLGKLYIYEDINDILGKIEKDYLGYEFLLNKDEKHNKLLVKLNEKIRTWEMLHDELNQTDEEKQIEDIAKFISNHYRTFVARLQQGVRQCLLCKLFARDEKTGLFKYKKAHKFLKEAADRGLIFAITGSSGDNTYLVDPNDEDNKTLKIISNRGEVKKIDVCAHPYKLFSMTFQDESGYEVPCDTIALIPFNDNFLSFKSSRQTAGVENTCKIVNHFTDRDNNKPMNITLRGASQGVDFITKMVGSTHGRTGTRIKNAEINLEINAPHTFQDEEKIVKRLINGNRDNKTTIKNINIANNMRKCLHPKYKTDNLIKWLKYYKQLNNNEVTLAYTKELPNGGASLEYL